MDYESLPHNFAVTGYAAECEHRGVFNKTHVCDLVAGLSGMAIGIDPATCAKCQLHGKVNHEFVQGLAAGAIERLLGLCVLDLARARGPEFLLSVADRALHLHPLPQRATVELHLLNMVHLGRLGVEDVRTLAKKHYPDDNLFHARINEAHARRLSITPLEAPPPGKCCGQKEAPKPSLFELASAAVKTGVKLVQFAASDTVDTATQNERATKCAACPLFNPDGYGPGLPSCGKPYSQQMVRDEKAEGCGCYLKLKWTGAKEVCPRGEW